VKLKCEEEENLKESYINANFINVVWSSYLVNQWIGENDDRNSRTSLINYYTLLENDFSGKCKHDYYVMQFEREW
jgi:hypothetical protein